MNSQPIHPWARDAMTEHPRMELTLGPGITAAIPVVEIDGRPLLPALVNTPKAKRLGGLLLIEKDLESVMALLMQLKEVLASDGTRTVAHGLYLAAVITYGKCFAEASGRRAQLHSRDHLKGASQEELEAHESLISTRNNYVAHGGESLGEHAGIWVRLDPNLEDGLIHGLFETVSYAYGATPATVDLYMRVVERVLANVRPAIEKAWGAVEEEVYTAGATPFHQHILARMDESKDGPAPIPNA